MKNCFLVLFALAAVAAPSVAFTVAPGTASVTTTNSRMDTSLNGFFDNAFKNDDSLGKPKDAGLSNGPQYNEQVTVNGKEVKGAVVGQKLTVVAGRARVKIPVNCQQGDCGTCIVNFNGRKVKACQATLPAGKAVIKTL